MPATGAELFFILCPRPATTGTRKRGRVSWSFTMYHGAGAPLSGLVPFPYVSCGVCHACWRYQERAVPNLDPPPLPLDGDGGAVGSILHKHAHPTHTNTTSNWWSW